MYQIAEQVLDWQRAGRPVTLARIVRTEGISSRDRCAAVGYCPGQPLAGSLLDGAVDADLPAVLAETPGPALIWLPVSEQAASAVGLSCGGRAQLLVQPADDGIDWPALANGDPLCLVTDLPGGETGPIGPTRSYRAGELAGPLPDADRLFRQGLSQTVLNPAGDQVITALWPTIRVHVVGGGRIAEALRAHGELLGWSVQVAAVLPAELILTAADNVIVLSHDLAISGLALATALAAGAGYVGALGSRHTQAARAAWLAEHQVPDTAVQRIHGPAGLSIGSRTPNEIALSILAQIVQVRAGAR